MSSLSNTYSANQQAKPWYSSITSVFSKKNTPKSIGPNDGLNTPSPIADENGDYNGNFGGRRKSRRYKKGGKSRRHKKHGTKSANP